MLYEAARLLSHKWSLVLRMERAKTLPSTLLTFHPLILPSPPHPFSMAAPSENYRQNAANFFDSVFFLAIVIVEINATSPRATIGDLR